MGERDATLIDTLSHSMVDLQTPVLGPLGAEASQHNDYQSSEGWSFFLFT